MAIRLLQVTAFKVEYGLGTKILDLIDTLKLVCNVAEYRLIRVRSMMVSSRTGLVGNATGI